ncbi:hypothetical protein ACQZV8_20570 [Magnetococcales bacterium HHB-1]
MTIRMILFCDACNPHEIYAQDRRRDRDQPEQEQRLRRGRRNQRERRILNQPPPEGLDRRHSSGRRPTDGVSWFLGTPKEAVSDGWDVDEREPRVICPRCRTDI